ncbi:MULTISPECIES: cytochrome P450 [unclassified Janthinobacterium]|uniref:cytochrome P450 n=1 Tax=unclassified Janthinobacterium TaxID=2610881 RepID=UPI0025AF0503|nr:MULTISPECIES: cytochrome P450 [unclassified Janthinobacterium]MDN2715183.1 cytochrome P450 [Janthinobacterium sp. SUN120]MDO8037424.1 cytochrome P450 [Janthinobacterium sp. SUN137]MDO8049032.1 cytochrome P450 [Janthinobacterium sp. SUN211]
MQNFNFFNLDQFAQSTPHEAFARFRREQPISWHSIPHAPAGEGFWLVARHKDICEVARQPRIFFSHGSSVLSDSVDIPHPAWKMIRDGLCHLDAPQHGELRRMVMPQFGAEAMSALQTVIRKRAVEVLDRAQEKGEIDLVSDIAARFPVRVVYGDVLGFADEDLPSAAFWGDLFNRVHAIPTGDREFADVMHASGVALDKLYRYGVAAYQSRRASPRNDVLSVLANIGYDDGSVISQEDFLSYFWSLAIGAYDTTASTIASGFATLAAHPEQQEALYADPSLIESAVEEMLRWETPVIYFRRTASEDYVLNGQAIRKGQRVVMCFASGNRDGDVFESPEVFDIRRRHNPHLSFGHGAHFCLGARLARIELRMLFEEVVARQLRFRPAGPAARARSNFINRIVSMPGMLESADLVTMSFN